jgi:hypothetical protein
LVIAFVKALLLVPACVLVVALIIFHAIYIYSGSCVRVAAAVMKPTAPMPETQKMKSHNICFDLISPRLLVSCCNDELNAQSLCQPPSDGAFARNTSTRSSQVPNLYMLSMS